MRERETALLTELQQLENAYTGEEIIKQLDQLRINKEQNISTLTSNDHQEVLQKIVTELDSGMKKLEANLEATRGRVRRVELEWDDSLDTMLANIGSIQVGGFLYSCDWKEALSETSIKQSIRKASHLEEKTSNLAIYTLTLREVFRKQESRIKRLEFGERSTESSLSNEKVILIAGASGAGKTTLIDSLVNYMFGVEYEDEFRFQLSREINADTQSCYLVVYTIHHQSGFSVPCTLTIIDTPGFGDTQRDTETVRQINRLFNLHVDEGIDHIDAVGIVVNSSYVGLDLTQKYVFDQILSLFGKDIGGNIYLMLTFADGKIPQILNGISETQIPYQEFFKFNNKAIFDDNSSEDELAKMFWKMGMKSFENFFNFLSGSLSKSLMQTQSVFEERELTETRIESLLSEIERGEDKLEQLKKEIKVVQEHKSDAEQYKDFTYTVVEERIVKHDTPPNSYVLSCANCDYTCLNPSPISDDGDIYHSLVMDRQGSLTAKCTICPNNCSWHNHKSRDFYFTTEKIEVIKTNEHLERNYLEASDKAKSVTAGIERKVDEFEAIHKVIISSRDVIRNSIHKLNEIALKPNPLSTGEYICILIESEKSAGEQGWQDRVRHLNRTKEKLEILAAIGKLSYDPFEAYKLISEVENEDIWPALCVYLQIIPTW